MIRSVAAMICLASIPTLVCADQVSDIIKVTESVCSSIPEGQLTKTTIQGKLEANMGLIAKIVSGDADISGSRAEEVYKGIPIDKLPENIPTVAMCKLELAKAMLGQAK